MENCPRLVIAGTGGDCGKTLIALSLAIFWRSRGLKIAAFKKGPDYIDSAWLGWASGSPARNLDSFIMGPEKVRESFFVNSEGFNIAVIEGNRGLHDGFDPQGTHSTAEIAKILAAPVILVVNAAKVTRTAAAIVLGCMKLDSEVNIAGVILNRVAGNRHQNILRESIEAICRIPVLGYIPSLKSEVNLPARHLGLVTPEEYKGSEGLRTRLANIAEKHIDTDRLEDIARRTPVLEANRILISEKKTSTPKVRICYFRDSAFTFYYPDNLEALETAGAELIPVSSLNDESLPKTDALLIGGGFPQTHLKELSFNANLRESVRKGAERGLPIYAECGGFIYLCQSLKWDEMEFELAGVLPLKLTMESKPQGHGYCRIKVDRENPFFPPGTILKGHEFHYTKVILGKEKVNTAYSVERGTGCFDGRDGVVYKNVLAGYLHLHALGTPQWAENFVNAAERRRFSRTD